MPNEYDNYMEYRYGSSIKSELLAEPEISLDQYKDFYIEELIKLSNKFPELNDIVINKNTGEVYTDLKESNPIETQFNSYSPTFKSDLDFICKSINSKNYIEWERL